MIRLFLILLAAARLWAEEISFKDGAMLRVGKREFDLQTEAGLRSLASSQENFPGKSASRFGKRDARGVAIMRHLATDWLAEENPEQKEKIQRQIFEIGQAVANNHRHPFPRYVDLLQAPFLLADALHNPVATKNIPAVTAELGDSTFWQRPLAIREMDLKAGFGRTVLPNYDAVLWNYAGPKKSGRGAGCVMESGGEQIKVKFGELHSEPFTARIFHALGYNVMPTDYAPRLRLKYDRRFLTEFNSRPELRMHAGIAFVPLYYIDLQNSFDPFDFIQSAVLQDVTAVSGPDLRRKLLVKREFDEEFEKQIDFLVTRAANVQVEPEGWQSIGPWDFGQLGHEDLREVRGAGVAAAWLGWWDSRYENTRLRVKRTDEGFELKHFISDLGGGLGFCGGTFKRSTEKPEDFEWSFTQKHKGRFEIVNYSPIEDTKAFERINVEDARWMAAMIEEISERQIEDALIASGFSSTDVRIYTDKLAQRREKLLEDLALRTPVLAEAE